MTGTPRAARRAARAGSRARRRRAGGCRAARSRRRARPATARPSPIPAAAIGRQPIALITSHEPLPQPRLVLDDEHGAVMRAAPRPGPAAARGALARQRQLEARHVSVPSVNHVAPVRARDRARDGQAEAGPLGLGGEERLEQLADAPGRNAAAAVLRRAPARRAVVVRPSPRWCRRRATPRWRCAARCRARAPWRRRRRPRRRSPAVRIVTRAARPGRQRLDARAQQRPEVGGVARPERAPRDDQQIGDQPVEPGDLRRRVRDRLHAPRAAATRAPPAGQIEPQLDRRQRIAHLVRDAGDHAAERGQPLLLREIAPQALLDRARLVQPPRQRRRSRRRSRPARASRSAAPASTDRWPAPPARSGCRPRRA